MKSKILAILLILVLVTVFAVACDVGVEQPTTQDAGTPADVTEPYSNGEEAPANQDDNMQNQPPVEETVDEHTVIQSLAEVWDWPGGTGHPFTIHGDGTWEHSTGDTGLYGNVNITESGGNFSLEFFVTRAEGAGVYGSPGIPAGYGWRYGDIWGTGMYSPATHELHFDNYDGSTSLMRRSSR